MIRARLSPKAVRDLDEHCGYIAGDNPEAAERVRRIILNTADFLQAGTEHPQRRATSRANSLVRRAEVPQLPDLLSAASGNHHGGSSTSCRTGLDAFLSYSAKSARVG